ncbi:MAG: hypothetical protein ACP5E5_02825 [Acidobacteriaceae bacterium]
MPYRLVLSLSCLFLVTPLLGGQWASAQHATALQPLQPAQVSQPVVIPASFHLSLAPDVAPAFLAQPMPVATPADANLPDDPDVALQHAASASPTGISSSSAQAASQSTPPNSTQPLPPPQPKRILGMVPNYRAVSAGVVPPPPTAKEAFMDATDNAFDYSDFVFVGLTSLIAEGDNAHPVFGKGVRGYWSYYWRGFLDKSDGDYWVDFILPTAFHEDERYYAKGRGTLLKRAIYAASQVIITPDYNGHNTINGAELLGRGVAEAVSVTYYPSQYATFSVVASKYGYAVLRDAGMNVFREFWPDFSVRVLHRQP